MAELENLLAEISKTRTPILIYESPMLIANAKAVGASLLRHRIPSIGFNEIAEGGGLLAYGVDIADMWRRSANYVDKILNGTKPGDIPVEQATKFELVVNTATARVLD